MSGSDEESQGPIIRDRRRIDPVTGQVRESARAAKRAPAKQGSSRRGGQGPGSDTTHDFDPAGPPGEADDARSAGAAAADGPERVASLQQAAATAAAALAERTADLQRLQAEYANYRKRVERDRIAVREQALASVLSGLLSVLDDISRAREHGELTGAFKSIAEALEGAVAKLGLITYGKAGEIFDPTVHEALTLAYAPDVVEPTCVQVLLPGYKVGDRILRAARVVVAEPADPTGARSESGGEARDGESGEGQFREGESGDGEPAGPAADDPAGTDGAGHPGGDPEAGGPRTGPGHERPAGSGSADPAELDD
jgi:molecular chaperone GrpE